jgi:hypothetical protein
MAGLVRRPLSHLARTLPWTLFTGAIVLARVVWPPRGLDAVGPVALRDLALTLALWLVVSVLGCRLGQRLIGLVNLPGLTRLEQAMFALALGLGALAYGVFALGVLGILRVGWIAVGLVLLSLWLGPRWPAGVAAIRHGLALGREACRSAELLARVLIALGILLGGLSFLHALSPPWDYDGLMYHLVGPRLFLEAGGFYPDTHNWYVNGPFTIEMLYTIGMAFGDDVFPKLVHWVLGVLFVVGTCAAGQRWLPRRGGWLSTAILLGTPTLPILAGFAYIDLGWAAFEFLGMFALVEGYQTRSNGWIGLGGALMGFSAGSKYLGLMALVSGGILIALLSLREGLGGMLSRSLVFAIPAVLIASPWYLKNWAWLGNPVYPFFIGGPGWDPPRLALYSSFLGSFGTGRSPIDFALLPLNVYIQRARFGAVMNQIDTPGLLFPMAFAYPFLKRGNSAISVSLWYALGRMVLWSLGSQQTRFLLPIYPALALAAAYVVIEGTSRGKGPLREHLLPALAVGLTLVPLFYQSVVLLQNRPLAGALGLESRREFLTRAIRGFTAITTATSNLQPGDKLLLLGSGAGYYCLPDCLPDPDHFHWAAIIAGQPPAQPPLEWLTDNHVSQVVLVIPDVDFFLQHDPSGTMAAAVARLAQWREEGCLGVVYRDDWSVAYELRCGA